MRQTLHLLFVSRDTRKILASRYAGRWVLPVATAGDRIRAAPWVQRWAAGRGLCAEVVGQWLGRISAAHTDWLMVLSVPAAAAPLDPQLSWIPLETLDPALALIEYQGWAVATSGAACTLPHVDGPFGDFDWQTRVLTWVARHAGPVYRVETVYRASAHGVVLSLETASGRVFFKGLSADAADEIRITRGLAALFPDSFASTIGCATTHDSAWWLTRACEGRTSAGEPEVARALAIVQQRAHGACLPLPELPLEQIEHWTFERLADSEARDRFRRAMAALRAANFPDSWIAMDLHPSNVLVTRAQATFIDLDESFRGLSALAMCVYVRRCRCPSLYRIYEEAWPARDRRNDWESLDIVAAVIETWLGARRLARHVARREVYVDPHHADCGIRRRLATAVHRT